MIRDAVEADIPSLVEMGRRFHGMSPHKFMGDFDAEAVGRMLRFMVDSPSAIVLTNGDGAIGAVLAPIYFDPSKLMCEESFWWAAKGGRALLDAMTDRAKELGASSVYLSTLDNDRSHVIDRVVSRMGFQPVERRYVKEL